MILVYTGRELSITLLSAALYALWDKNKKNKKRNVGFLSFALL